MTDHICSGCITYEERDDPIPGMRSTKCFKMPIKRFSRLEDNNMISCPCLICLIKMTCITPCYKYTFFKHVTHLKIYSSPGGGTSEFRTYYPVP